MYRSGHFGVALVFAAVTVGIAPTPTGFAIALLIVATERIPDYDLRDVERTLVVRVTESEFGA